jgi:Bacteriophage lambda head decoration protein D
MPLIATENRRFSNVVKEELWPNVAYCRLVVTVNEATAKSYVPGTVLGKVTANGKYKIAVQTQTDGSQVGAAIALREQSIAAATDTQVLTLVKGPSAVSKFGLQFDATYSEAQKAPTYAAFEAAGIMVLESV